MIPALITAFLWSLCVVTSHRSVQQLGENPANFWRMLFAVVWMAAIAHGFGLGLAGAGLVFFLISGLVGFGLGDIGVFHALPRIGSRLTILMAQCLAAPIAGFVEWYWLGTVLSIWQIAAVSMILAGVALALMPSRRDPPKVDYVPGRMLVGVLFGLLAAFGQGMGAVLSRKAYMVAEAAGTPMISDSTWTSVTLGATAGYQRLIGGFALIAIYYFIREKWLKNGGPAPSRSTDPFRSKLGFVGINAMTGPVVGLICFQWALATTPSMIVQPIVALTPLIIMPMAWWMEGDRPSPRAVAGACVAVAGVIALAWAI